MRKQKDSVDRIVDRGNDYYDHHCDCYSEPAASEGSSQIFSSDLGSFAGHSEY
jgi:hypothetical protein